MNVYPASALDSVSIAASREISTAGMCASCGKHPPAPGFAMCVVCRHAAGLPVDAASLAVIKAKSEAETLRLEEAKQRFAARRAAEKENEMHKEFTCECGRSFDTRGSLGQHKRHCNETKAPVPETPAPSDGTTHPDCANEPCPECCSSTGTTYPEAEEQHVDVEARVAPHVVDKTVINNTVVDPKVRELSAQELTQQERLMVEQAMTIIALKQASKRLKLELIETRLRLISANIEAYRVAPSLRCAIEDDTERISTLIKEVAR